MKINGVGSRDYPVYQEPLGADQCYPMRRPESPLATHMQSPRSSPCPETRTLATRKVSIIPSVTPEDVAKWVWGGAVRCYKVTYTVLGATLMAGGLYDLNMARLIVNASISWQYFVLSVMKVSFGVLFLREGRE